MFSKTILLGYLAAKGGVVTSFAFAPSPTRSNLLQPSRHVLFASKDGEEQQQDDVAIASKKKADDAAAVDALWEDGLNVEKFKAELEEFSAEEEEITKTKKAGQELKTSVLSWKFRGEHDIYAEVTYPPVDWKTARSFSPEETLQSLPAVVLVHGFGCSTAYWRHTTRALALQGHVVYALDLLGHGKSAKPYENVEYSTALWAEQLDGFCAKMLAEDEDIVLIGNSVGSLVSLLAATGDYQGDHDESKRGEIRERLRGIGMFNCGIGLNVRGITRDPKWNKFQRTLLNAVFDAMESPALFGNLPVVKLVLEKVATPRILRGILRKLYARANDPVGAIDDDFVASFVDPVAGDPDSAAKVLSQILSNDAGPTPMELHTSDELLTRYLPIHVVWGDSDDVTPLDGIGGVAQFYEGLASASEGNNKVTMKVVEGGHILFDEVPETANGAMLQWLNEL